MIDSYDCGTTIAIAPHGGYHLKRKIVHIVFVLLFPFTCMFAQENSDESEPETPPPQEIPRFIDRNGDGFNDLAPDLDGDGVPDALDPDFLGTGDPLDEQSPQFRWAWYRAIPDSIKTDSVQFQLWWDENGLPIEWELVWEFLREIREEYGVDGRPRWWDYNGFDPRRRPFRNDPRRSRSRSPGG